jgi:hypothetical protein
VRTRRSPTSYVKPRDRPALLRGSATAKLYYFLVFFSRRSTSRIASVDETRRSRDIAARSVGSPGDATAFAANDIAAGQLGIEIRQSHDQRPLGVRSIRVPLVFAAVIPPNPVEPPVQLGGDIGGRGDDPPAHYPTLQRGAAFLFVIVPRVRDRA